MDPDRSLRLESLLTKAVAALRFGEVMDLGPVQGAPETGGPGGSREAGLRPIAHTPNIDTAVIDLDRDGRPLAAANVLLSRDHPAGISVPVGAGLGADPGTSPGRGAGAGAVRWRRWDQARWDGGRFSEEGRLTSAVGWDDDPPFTADDDIVAGREAAPITFMEPYPASVFKLPVAFHVLRLADAGLIDLDRPLPANRGARPGPIPDRDARGGALPSGSGPAALTARRHLDAMITTSDNDAARALLKLLHDLHEMDSLDEAFRELGLGTLQVQGTDPATGGRWQVGRITATSLDLARLLLIVGGAPGILWRTPQGRPVEAGVLSPSCRSLLKDLLAEQGWNDVLSTTNWCGGVQTDPGEEPGRAAAGGEQVVAGIPARVAQRWIDPATGAVCVGGQRFGGDVRPCNAWAEVTFAHKTGFTSSFLADAGIVEALPGRRYRHYVVAVLSNLGYRFADRRLAPRSTGGPAGRRTPYTEQLAILGRAVDGLFPLETCELTPKRPRRR